MDRDIAGLRDHRRLRLRPGREVGVGSPARSRDRIVVVDTDEERMDEVTLPFVVGDASNDDVLRAAGIERARALICALDTDVATTYATLSARAPYGPISSSSVARGRSTTRPARPRGRTRAVNHKFLDRRPADGEFRPPAPMSPSSSTRSCMTTISSTGSRGCGCRPVHPSPAGPSATSTSPGSQARPCWLSVCRAKATSFPTPPTTSSCSRELR